MYQRGKTWPLDVDRAISFDQLKHAVEENFTWSCDQRMTVWYYSPEEDGTVPLISESEISQLFDRCMETRLVRFGVTI